MVITPTGSIKNRCGRLVGRPHSTRREESITKFRKHADSHRRYDRTLVSLNYEVTHKCKTHTVLCVFIGRT